ncbi:transcriptional regulator, partial [Halorubrum saccharovorum]
MPRENYQEELNELRADVVAMGELVGERYASAIEAAATGDDELAEEVVEGDSEVNETYLGLEEECTELLALQQPVAGDLRLVTASFKVITDLERVADLATNLAGYGGPDGGVHPAVEFRELGEDAGEMVADAVAADERATPRPAA